MATIGINISNNFNETSKDFKKLTNTTNAETKRIRANLKRIEQFEADKFIQKNKRVALSVKATRGATAALATEHRGLERKIQMLIRNGVDPMDDKLKELRREYKRTSQEIKKTSKTSQSFSSALTSTAIAVGGFIFAVTKATKVASDLEEATTKFNTVFATTSMNMNEQVKILTSTYAMSTREARQNLSSMQDLLVPMGMNANAAAKMSSSVVQLAADLGSFNNLPTKKVMADMQSAIVGNFETMKKYGIVLNETVIKQKALTMGLWNGKGAIDAVTKAQVAWKIIQEGSTAAQGDMIRTSDSFANQMKFMKASIEDLIAGIGKFFLPIMKNIVSVIREVVQWFNGLDDGIKETIIMVATIGTAIILAVKVFKLFKGVILDTFKSLKAAILANPLLAFAAGITALILILGDGSKSLKEFEDDIKSAEKTIENINVETKKSKEAFLVFEKSTKNASVGSEQYRKSVDELLKQTPKLKEYGVTVTSTFQEITQAQKLMQDSMKTQQVLKADEEYKKLADGIEDLRFNLARAYDELKSDPTKVNLANAKKYANLLKRNQLAMQRLGKISGRSGAEIKQAFSQTSGLAGEITRVSDDAVKSLQKINSVADITGKNISNTLLGIGNISRIISGLKLPQQQKTTTKKTTTGKDPGFEARIKGWQILERWADRYERQVTKTFDTALNKSLKVLNLTKSESQEYFAEVERLANRARRVGGLTATEFQVILAKLDQVRESYPIDRMMKAFSIQEKIVKGQIKEINGLKISSSQKIQLLQDEQRRIMELTSIGQEQKLMLIQETENQITEIQKAENEKRKQIVNQLTSTTLSGFANLFSEIGALRTAETQRQVAQLEESYNKEVKGQALTDKQKEKLKKKFEKEKARMEFEGAMKTWKLNRAAAVANGALAIINAFATQPFIPVGVAAGALATTLTGIQLATVNKSKPQLGAETGGSFIVPDNRRSTRSDNQTLAVNPGEEIEVNPRGQSKKIVVNNFLDKTLLYTVVQEGFDNGEINITNDNIVSRG